MHPSHRHPPSEAQMKVALLCSGLGNIHRGHEVFARDLFNLLEDDVDITLFKGGGTPLAREWVIEHVPRNTKYLDDMHLPVAPKWQSAAQEVERMRVEGETFAYASLKHLLEGDFDVIHCLEQEVCNVIYGFRHLFRKPPKILWSNGGALPAASQPQCDFVQEHTEGNLANSNREKAFVIPHGIDLQTFHPGVETDFRSQHGIPPDAFVVISVGTICYWHKRMDYVIREVAAVPDAWLVIVGQESSDSPAIKALGREFMEDRIIFTTMPHNELPKAYAAADVFVLGSLFETFGIVYIEAMAMGLPVICTNHPNQKSIVKEGVFIDMKQSGALAIVLSGTNRNALNDFAEKGLRIVTEHYDLQVLKRHYIAHYQRIAASQPHLPTYSLGRKLIANLRNTLKQFTA